MGLFAGRRTEPWLVLLFFTVLTLVLTYPLALSPGRVAVADDPDVHTYTWTLGWNAHALATRPWALFDANIFHPYDRTLAFSENLIGSALVAAPVIWLTGNYVLAINGVSLLSVILCGAGAYVLGRRIGLSAPAALLCGAIFAFSPARFFRFPQLHLTAIQWIPFCLASLHTYFDGGRARDLRLAILFFALQGLTSLHGGVFLALAIAVWLVHRAALVSPRVLVRRVRDVGMGGAALLLMTGAIAIPYLQVQRDRGFVRTLENWIPTPESFLASPTHVHQWILRHVFATPINEQASAFLFPGYVPLVFAAIALASLRSQPHRRSVVLYGAIALLGLALSSGPPISIWPWVYWLPGFNFIRIPSRFFLLTVLGLAVLAGIGFDFVARRRPPAMRLGAGAIVCALLIAECAAMPLALVPYAVEFAAVDRWLAAQPRPFAVAEVPVGATMRSHSTFMIHSMAHWEKTVHGHSSILPALHERLYDRLRAFPARAALDALSDTGVTHVVVHIDMYRPDEWTTVERAIEQQAARLIPLYADASGRVYRLQPPPSAGHDQRLGR